MVDYTYCLESFLKFVGYVVAYITWPYALLYTTLSLHYTLLWTKVEFSIGKNDLRIILA